jgi:hypothetical protein
MMLKSPVSDVAYLTSAAIFNNPLNFAGIDQFVAPACYKMFVEAMQNSMPPSWLKEYVWLADGTRGKAKFCAGVCDPQNVGGKERHHGRAVIGRPRQPPGAGERTWGFPSGTRDK